VCDVSVWRNYQFRAPLYNFYETACSSIRRKQCGLYHGSLSLSVFALRKRLGNISFVPPVIVLRVLCVIFVCTGN